MSLPCKVTILIEGEEENGSTSLKPFIEKYKDLLKADCALICDTTMWNAKTPSISTMLRGMVGEEVTITAAGKDLHSGMFGGVTINPIHMLSSIICSLHTNTGTVSIANFYDGVNKIPVKLKKQWRKLEFSEEEFQNENLLTGIYGEEKFFIKYCNET